MGSQTATTMDTLTRLKDWQAELRAEFPIIVNHPEMAYLDSAATSQKPQAVLDAVAHYLTTGNANAGRGSYPWANATTALVERTREQVKEFVADPDPQRSGVHFVSGASDGLRRVALDWLIGQCGDGDEIIVPAADHNANLAPWWEMRDQLARQGTTIVVREMPYDDSSGDYDHRALPALVNDRTKFVAATHVHHVYGADMNVHRIRSAVGPDVPICLDAAQSFGHMPVSMSELDVDFLVFSGHKTLALPGSGAIWARNLRGEPFTPNGWAGTPNISGIVSLAAAIDWLDQAGTKSIEDWMVALGSRLTDGLSRMDAIEVLGCQNSLDIDSDAQRRNGIASFVHRDIGSNDLGFILASHGLMVRSDSHCQGSRTTEQKSIRVSVHVYNTAAEIDRLLAALDTLR